MDFLTTNFPEDTTSEFTGPFRLLDLPLEILFRVLVFLDDPEMRSLAETCRTLRNVARERFIQRSKFFYVRDKIGIRLTELRPALSELYHQHIVPVQNVNMLGNTAHVTVINDLQRSFRRDSLSKSLQKRPMLSELKEKNIIPLDSSTSPLIKTRVKELKQENLSQMLQLLLKSYRFQKKIVNSDVDVNVKISTFESPGDQSSTTAPQDLPSPDRKTLISKIEIIEKKRQGKVNTGQYHDVSDEFIRIYNRLCSRFGHTIKPSNQRSLSTPVPSSASVNSTSPSTPLRAKNHPLNQLPPLNSSPISTIKSTRRTVSLSDTPHTPTASSRKPSDSRASSTSSCFSTPALDSSPNLLEVDEEMTDKQGFILHRAKDMTSVRSKKQYFEQLSHAQESNSTNSSRTPSDSFLRSVSRDASGTGIDVPSRKPSRTVLKAKVINDSIISYEKLF
ncbi:CYFA0S27e01024g1_1 [Cyberlindnera fabianii]|uniref:CYFA0S27e01024g1_1 n=1 Tax=Cyberlindnera fabianii TaxID=36022 RepID=A0A061BCG5_CYBFA|nr:CYFA0S27e01024g1_1 [Cyberlindnera fabianii]